MLAIASTGLQPPAGNVLYPLALPCNLPDCLATEASRSLLQPQPRPCLDVDLVPPLTPLLGLCACGMEQQHASAVCA
jgi:hypothetical protein